ncbi:squalene/phytoene synthase family protein, partial [Nostoc sp. NIES-2111]
DEIENHSKLDKFTKVKLLKMISLSFQTMNHITADELSIKLSEHQKLPELTIRISEWASLAPETIAPLIWSATAVMADRMAYWVNRSWQINTESDLDCYTFSVAGAVGLLLSDLWAWYDGTQTNRTHAIGFGRGLQAVKILRNRSEDLTRQVNLFPHNWNQENMHNYARRNLCLADFYIQAISSGSIKEFCQFSLALAHTTLNVVTLEQH